MSPSRVRQLRLLTVPVALTLALPLLAWGPHPEIVDAALSVLPADDHLAERLGADAGRLRLLVWMGDWADNFMPIQETWEIDKTSVGRAAYYTNDYLIFPESPRNHQHIVPDVVDTYRPFFLRTLQALRTETPTNAARWLGSLLHYVTDTGSPPHALGILGAAHTKMENWVDPAQIGIKGYHPRLLGKTDEEALQGLLDRMNGLIEFSRARAERLRPFIAANDRPGSEPIALESANECARVAADLIHTLMVLDGIAASAPRADFYARIAAPSVDGMEVMPAKLILLDTLYSTMSEPLAMYPQRYQGTLQLRNLPPGTYQAVVYRVGCSPVFLKPMVLKPGANVSEDLELEASSPPGNLVRNPDFKIFWSSHDRPEHWQYGGDKKGWISDRIRIDARSKYRVVAALKSAAPARVSLEWLRTEYPWQVGEAVDVSDGRAGLAPPVNAAYARLVIQGRELPSVVLKNIALVRE